MAEKNLPTTDSNGKDITPHILKTIVEGKEVSESPVKKAAKMFLAEDIEDIAGSIVDDFVKPRTKSFGLDMVKKLKEFVFDSINDLARKMIFGSTSSNSKSGYYNGSRVNYVSYYNGDSSDYYGSSGYYRNDAIGSDPVTNLKRVSIPDYGKAKEVLTELRMCIKHYDKASVADYYQAVGLQVNKNDFVWGWAGNSLDNAQIIRAGRAYIIDLPKPVPI